MKLCAFSPCRKYRYTLWREFEPELEATACFNLFAMFIGLNPSTADDDQDDPTIRRCIGFARSWGYGSLVMTNLFAWRATLPDDMKKAADPVGPENDIWLTLLAKNQSVGVIVAAWGANGSYLHRDEHVKRLIPNLQYLRITKTGHPEHPLYLPKNLLPKPL